MDVECAKVETIEWKRRGAIIQLAVQWGAGDERTERLAGVVDPSTVPHKNSHLWCEEAVVINQSQLASTEKERSWKAS